jgi:hypothetical protein
LIDLKLIEIDRRKWTRMIRSEVKIRSHIQSRHEGQTFIDDYFPEHHRMPRPIHLGQAGELQSKSPLIGG